MGRGNGVAVAGSEVSDIGWEILESLQRIECIRGGAAGNACAGELGVILLYFLVDLGWGGHVILLL
jgi:hypothetical protein